MKSMKTKVLTISAMAVALAMSAPGDEVQALASPADEEALQTLRDLGVTPQMVLDMVQRQLREQMTTEAAPPGVETDPETAVPTAQAEPPGTNTVILQGDDDVVIVKSPEVKSADDFYSTLAPYGVWYDLPPYGRVWQPAVGLIDTSWRPYCDAGQWRWIDDGWYWHSAYSWGWAPFHYGRWAYVPRHRWVWVPDTVWAPSWVQWRSCDTDVGWAPLPPEACYRAGIGFSFRGSRVSADFEFGLRDWAYTFVPTRSFHERNLRRVACAPREAERIFPTSRVVRQTHTTRSQLELPSFPRTIASDSDRRSVNVESVFRRQVFEDHTVVPRTRTPIVNTVAPSGAPATMGATDRARSILRRTTPPPAVGSAVMTAPSAPPNFWPAPRSEGRSDAVREVFRRQTEASAPPTPPPPVAATVPRFVEPIHRETPQPDADHSGGRSQALRDVMRARTVAPPAPPVVAPPPPPAPVPPVVRGATDKDSDDDTPGGGSRRSSGILNAVRNGR